MKRRKFVLTTGALAATGLTGCLGNGNGNGENGNGNGNGGDGPEVDFDLVSEEPDYQGYFEGIPAYEHAGGTADWTGQDSVTVQAGIEGDRTYTTQFWPAAIKVDPGTTVQWEWKTSGHNVVRDTDSEYEDVDTGGEWEGDDSIANPPNTYENTFDEEGVYLYVCTPHKSLGMLGAVVVGSGDGSMDGDGSMEDNTSDDNTSGAME